ncbi:113_t:CDS:2 [Ambispora gerdemannii]|uniref:113_t:CDS:1 n=1 Tax=Ambispora gerdemannii TaxID=144530 RepID=A0A9N8VN56_9GLOM|nr:113_t:CDS:2 [Ambispora gerdemannii]
MVTRRRKVWIRQSIVTVDKDLIKASQQPPPHKRPDVLKRGHNFITNVSTMRNIIDDLNDKEEAIVEKKLNRSRAVILNQQEDKKEHQNNIQEKKKTLIEVSRSNMMSVIMMMTTRKEMIEKMKVQLKNKKREKKKLRKVNLGQMRSKISQEHVEEVVDEKNEIQRIDSIDEKLNTRTEKRVRFNL